MNPTDVLQYIELNLGASLQVLELDANDIISINAGDEPFEYEIPNGYIPWRKSFIPLSCNSYHQIKHHIALFIIILYA